MKSLHTPVLVLVATAALAVSVAAQQPASGNQQKQGTQTMQGMEGMQEGQHGKMHGMMQDCHKDIQTVMQSNDQAKKEVEAAKQSNDLTKMRTALDTAVARTCLFSTSLRVRD